MSIFTLIEIETGTGTEIGIGTEIETGTEIGTGTETEKEREINTEMKEETDTEMTETDGVEGQGPGRDRERGVAAGQGLGRETDITNLDPGLDLEIVGKCRKYVDEN